MKRRTFLKQSTAIGTGFVVLKSGILRGQSPNEKLNIAGIGVGGMGRNNLSLCADENIVALCDIDQEYAAKTYKKYPKAKVYRDYRKMLDK